CALTSTGQMKCWGSNQSGLYANGAVSNACNATPIAATLPVPLVKVALGQLHACGLTATGAVYCWGNNAAGAVGMPLSQIYLTPQLVPGLEAGVLDVVTGNLHSCALLKDASVRCWGDDHKSQLGINRQHTNTIYTPTQPVGLGLGIKSIHAGEFNTCAVTTDGFAKCWGSNSGSIFDQGYDSIYFPHEVSDEQPSF
ncbi:MAG: RCC1 domain-containing protein, partial [Bdellovibrionales bacterium]